MIGQFKDSRIMTYNLKYSIIDEKGADEDVRQGPGLFGLKNEDLLGDDKDELLDLLDRLGVTTMPTQPNLKELLLKAGHKQIIQLPKYALDNMSGEAKQIFRETFNSPVDVLQMYEDKRPNKKVLENAGCLTSNSSREQVLAFFTAVHQRIRWNGIEENA
ncbi:uncharacterized protein LOC125141387 [Tachysurus ichikawai]